MHIRYELTPSTAQPFPIFIESIGHHEDQERLVRPEGYPCYHWLQTYDGEGEFILGGKKYAMPKGTGVMLMPGVPHSYYAVTEKWCTQYITFSGACAEAILSTLELLDSAVYKWDENGPLHLELGHIIEHLDNGPDYTGYDASADLYRFFIQLRKYGEINNRVSIRNQIAHLQPLLNWLETSYHNPDTSLEQMARVLAVTPRHMNTMFQIAFGLSPYAYLIRMRLRKSKEMLLQSPNTTVKEVAVRAGFRDVSHFVSSFRKHVGLTPERFRQMN